MKTRKVLKGVLKEVFSKASLIRYLIVVIIALLEIAQYKGVL